MMDKKLLFKLLGIVMLTLCLMVPLVMIQEQIGQRSSYQHAVRMEIAQTAAGAQTLIGPVLAIRYRTQLPPGKFQDPKTGEVLTRYTPQVEERLITLPAETLNIKGQAKVEQRHRGIYQARLFHVDLNLDGQFEVPADLLPLPRNENEQVDAHAVLLFGASDLRGVESDPEVRINGRSFRFATPRDNRMDALLPGNRLEIELGRLPLAEARSFKFDFPLQLMGTEVFSIAPTARDNQIQIASDWPHPSFQGRFLPLKRQLGSQGFTAQWRISHLGRNLEDALQANDRNSGQGEVLGVNFMEPVNIYLQSERAVKYGSLFIVLSFAAFFLGEILRRHPMHVLQYLLVGLALTIFFLLLIALSEHLPFLYAYLVAATGCIGLITFYLSGVLKGWRPAFAFGAGFVSLYGILYGVLKSEDNALLMGSLLLFAALAAIMTSTRRLNWYKLNSATPEEGDD
jgi:inner membrane protein